MGDNAGCFALVVGAGLLFAVALAPDAEARVGIVFLFLGVAGVGMTVAIFVAWARGHARRKRRSQLQSEVEAFLERVHRGEEPTPQELASIQQKQREIEEINEWFREIYRSLKRERERRQRRGR